MRRFFSLLSILFFILSCGEEPVLNTFGSISGIVQDSKTVSPLSGVKVSITPLGYSQVTGNDGAFLFDNLEIQEYTLVFTKDGYKSDQQKLSVKPGKTAPLHISLTSIAGSFVATPSELFFGESETSMKIQVRNVSGVATQYSTSVSNGWLSVSPTTGTITQSDYLTVMVSREGLSPGEYKGEIIIKYIGETLVIPVIMTVVAKLPPVVTIESVSSITSTSATVSANLTSMGTSGVAKMGICWSAENESPTVTDNSTNQGDASAPCSFTAVLSGLTAETTYYCRAYAMNDTGVGYSSVLSFTTLSEEGGEGPGGGGDGTSDVTGGLVLSYTFDNKDVTDQSINGLDGRAINDPSYIEDTPTGNGYSIFVNAIKDQSISIDYNVFKGLSGYTISMWMKGFQPGMWIAGLKSSNSDADCPLIYWEGTDELYFDSFGITSFTGGMSNPSLKYTFSSIQSEWHHIVIICDKKTIETHQRELFIDSHHVHSNEYSVPTYRVSDSEPYKVVIGGDADGKYNKGGSFQLDNFRIYSRCLSEKEIKTLFDNKK